MVAGDLWQSNVSRGEGKPERKCELCTWRQSFWSGLLIYKAEHGWETEGWRDKAKGVAFRMEVA